MKIRRKAIAIGWSPFSLHRFGREKRKLQSACASSRARVNGENAWPSVVVGDFDWYFPRVPFCFLETRRDESLFRLDCFSWPVRERSYIKIPATSAGARDRNYLTSLDLFTKWNSFSLMCFNTVCMQKSWLHDRGQIQKKSEIQQYNFSFFHDFTSKKIHFSRV